MKKKQTFDKILYRNYICLILITAILIALFSAGIDAANTLANEKRNMYESLKQAQININNHTQMIDDYLTLTHCDGDLQRDLRTLASSPKMSALSRINEKLFSVDLFKKNLDTMQVFLYDETRFLPAFSRSGQYGSAVFSAESVSFEDWFQSTLAADGSTYWFIDTTSYSRPALCGARILYDLKDLNRPFGVIKASVSIEKLIRHLNSLSFGDRGYALFLADGEVYSGGRPLPESIASELSEYTSELSGSHLLIKFPVIRENWQVIGIISKWELYRNTLQNLLLIGLVSFLSLLLAIVLSRQNSRKISSPIHGLCQQMKLMQKAENTGVSDCIEIYQLYDTYNHMLEKNELLMRSREDALLKVKQAEMAALQSQMNPHFIYNTLESINALIAIGDNTHASQMTEGLGYFLRSSLNNGNLYISLEKEIAQVSAYIQIQKLRYQSKLELILDLPSPLPDYRIIKLILQPLAENCIIHGFKDFDTPGTITISVRESENTLILSVADNGWGSDIEMLNHLIKQRTLYQENQVNFYCIQNVYSRLQNCYGENFRFTYEENSSGGVTAVIQIDKSVL